MRALLMLLGLLTGLALAIPVEFRYEPPEGLKVQSVSLRGSFNGWGETPMAPVEGGFAVTLLQQAKFLRIAYSYASRYDQVKNLFWYLVQDVGGVSTGLRTTTGWHKPSWFAFAGGNSVSIYALPYVKPGSYVNVRGKIACETFGPVPDRTVRLQGRRLGALTWSTLASVRTDAEGRYLFRPTVWRPMQYRVVWPEIKTSDVRTVRVY